MSGAAGEGHVDEGTLVRLLDGAAGADERRAAEAHLAACAHCRAERERLARWDGAVQRLLASDVGVPAPPPLRRATRGRQWPAGLRGFALLAAALVLAAVLVPPVRALAQALVERVRSAVLGAGSDVAPPTAAPGPRPAPESRLVELVPDGDGLVLQFDAVAPGAVLDAEPHEMATVVLNAVAERLPAVLVRPGGITVSGSDAAATRFRVMLPPGVRTLTVRVAGAAPVVVSRDSLVLAGARRISLGARD